jgi:hypothetical protein
VVLHQFCEQALSPEYRAEWFDLFLEPTTQACLRSGQIDTPGDNYLFLQLDTSEWHVSGPTIGDAIQRHLAMYLATYEYGIDSMKKAADFTHEGQGLRHPKP